MENGRSLVDKDPYQPTVELAFTIERWRIVRRSKPTVLHSEIGSLRASEHPARCEVKQPITAREPVIEYL